MAGDTAIPKDVGRFLDKYVDSVTRLEILLVLHQSSRTWRVDEIAREFRTNADHVRNELNALTRARLAKKVGDGFAAGDDREIRALVASVASVYTTHRVAVTTHIFSKPSPSVRGFSDAFRFRKEE